MESRACRSGGQQQALSCRAEGVADADAHGRLEPVPDAEWAALLRSDHAVGRMRPSGRYWDCLGASIERGVVKVNGQRLVAAIGLSITAGWCALMAWLIFAVEPEAAGLLSSR